MKIICIVGIKNSGKTFYVQKLIEYFKKKNLKVASIKHAHHNFDIDYQNTDSFKHRKAGSDQVIVSSSKRWAKITELKDQNEKKLVNLINELDKTDVIVVEGFKNENYPKVEIVKDPDDSSLFLFPKLKNVIAIISEKYIETEIKQFRKDQINLVANYILDQRDE